MVGGVTTQVRSLQGQRHPALVWLRAAEHAGPRDQGKGPEVVLSGSIALGLKN